MESLVVDTDVVSFLARADTRAAKYAQELAERRPCVCFQTVAELRLWESLRRWGPARREAVDALLRRFIVLPYDAPMAQYWPR